MRLIVRVFLCLGLCTLPSACSNGPKPVKVTGTLVNDGKPYSAPKGSSVLITFVPADGDTKAMDTYPTKMRADDSGFAVPGREGKGIPPGKYRIALQQMVPGGSDEINAMNERFSPNNSPIYVEVKEESPLVIDIAKK